LAWRDRKMTSICCGALWCFPNLWKAMLHHAIMRSMVTNNIPNSTI
jgi:hypothetical protein